MPTTDRARVLAVKLLLRQTITSLQTDPFHLDCSGTILVDSLQHYAVCVGRRPEEFMADSIQDCLVLQRKGKHLILYNQDILCSARKRWSVAHEIGHICCRHCCDKPPQENEANAFAAELLVPSVVAGELYRRGRIKSPADLCTLFGISAQAACHRFSELDCHQPTQLEVQLLQSYLPVIEEELHGPIIKLPRRCHIQRSPLLM